MRAQPHWGLRSYQMVLTRGLAILVGAFRARSNHCLERGSNLVLSPVIFNFALLEDHLVHQRQDVIFHGTRSWVCQGRMTQVLIQIGESTLLT